MPDHPLATISTGKVNLGPTLKKALTQDQLEAIKVTLDKISRGIEKRPLMSQLLFDIFPNEDRTFLDYWAGHRYVHLRSTAFPDSQEWILTDMVQEVIVGSARVWYNGWLKEYAQPESLTPASDGVITVPFSTDTALVTPRENNLQ
jgi:hypothetical protein